MEAWLGETPAAFISMDISPYFCVWSIKLLIEYRFPKSISSGTTSKPASFIIFAVACAFFRFLSPTTIFFPYPTLRAIAMPICPAPVHTTTSRIIHLLLTLQPTFVFPKRLPRHPANPLPQCRFPVQNRVQGQDIYEIQWQFHYHLNGLFALP